MEYRHDNDLEFLRNIKSEDLEDLVYCITHDKDGEVRFTEELTNSKVYKLHHPNHTKYWDLIAAEIQHFGGNSFANMFRGGRGVEYKEVLIDVCDKMKVNYNKYSSVDKIESNLLMKILTDALEKMSAEDAEKYGLIWQCVADDALDDTVNEVATRLANGPTKAYPQVRKLFDMASTQDIHAQLDLEAEIQPRLAATEDYVEGVRAFLQKRKPEFKGR